MVVLAVEGGGHLVVGLDELVDRVGRVPLGVGDLVVDVVAAVLGVGGLQVVCLVHIPAALDTGFRRYDGQVCFGGCGSGAGDGFPPPRERRCDFGGCGPFDRLRTGRFDRPFDQAQDRFSANGLGLGGAGAGDGFPTARERRSVCVGGAGMNVLGPGDLVTCDGSD